MHEKNIEFHQPEVIFKKKYSGVELSQNLIMLPSIQLTFRMPNIYRYLCLEVDQMPSKHVKVNIMTYHFSAKLYLKTFKSVQMKYCSRLWPQKWSTETILLWMLIIFLSFIWNIVDLLARILFYASKMIQSIPTCPKYREIALSWMSLFFVVVSCQEKLKATLLFLVEMTVLHPK